MAMKSSLAHAIILLSAIFLWGCGSSEYSLSQTELAAFNSATPEMKQAWEKGLQADKANDYVVASTNFRSLLSQPITAQQLAALQTALGGMAQRMNEAAAKGDASAKKALETLSAGATGPRR